MRAMGADVYVPSHLRTATQVEADAFRADLHELTGDATGAVLMTTPMADEMTSTVRLELEAARRSGVAIYTLPQTLDLIERVVAECRDLVQEAVAADGSDVL